MTESMLAATGSRLAAQEVRESIVVLGGAAMNLHGFVSRPTRDVDVLARVDPDTGVLRHPEPLSRELSEAIAAVAFDFGQPSDWMNRAVAHQWLTGLPPGLERRITWRDYEALRVGLVGGYDLVFFKLYAAADQVGPRSVHMEDLLALRRSADELATAAGWIRTQDTSVEFHAIVDRVIAYVRDRIP